MANTTWRAPDDLYEAARKEASDSGRSINELITDAVRDKLGLAEPSEREFILVNGERRYRQFGRWDKGCRAQSPYIPGVRCPNTRALHACFAPHEHYGTDHTCLCGATWGNPAPSESEMEPPPNDRSWIEMEGTRKSGSLVDKYADEGLIG